MAGGNSKQINENNQYRAIATGGLGHVTVTNSAIVTQSTTATGGAIELLDDTQVVIVSVEDAAIRVSFSVDPVTAGGLGVLWTPGTEKELSAELYRTAKFIADTATNARVNVVQLQY